MVSADALVTANMRAIKKLYMYIDKKERQRPAFKGAVINNGTDLEGRDSYGGVRILLILWLRYRIISQYFNYWGIKRFVKMKFL